MWLTRLQIWACLALILVFLPALLAGTVRADDVAEQSPKTFSLETVDKVTIRKNATTQIAIRVEQWPGQTFLLWLPEAVEPLWRQWDGDIGLQRFVKTERNGLRWTFDRLPQATITAELTPRPNSLLAEVRVVNRGDQPIHDLMAQNCLHFSAAPAFACDDFSRIFIRTGGQWKTLRELQPTVNLPMYYRKGVREANRPDSWKGQNRGYDQQQRVDHPLIACISKDGSKTDQYGLGRLSMRISQSRRTILIMYSQPRGSTGRLAAWPGVRISPMHLLHRRRH